MVARSVLDMEYGTANKHHALTLLLDIGFCAFFSRSLHYPNVFRYCSSEGRWTHTPSFLSMYHVASLAD